jgi:hypothetical protein
LNTYHQHNRTATEQIGNKMESGFAVEPPCAEQTQTKT